MIKFIFFIPLFLWGIPSLEQTFDYPHTYFRDFYLTQYLKKVKNIKEADKIYNTITYKKRQHK